MSGVIWRFLIKIFIHSYLFKKCEISILYSVYRSVVPCKHLGVEKCAVDFTTAHKYNTH